MSRGAKTTPANPAAPTAAKREASGEDDERTSRPPTAENIGAKVGDDAWAASPGSGRPSRAQISERAKEVSVETRTE